MKALEEAILPLPNCTIIDQSTVEYYEPKAAYFPENGTKSPWAPKKAKPPYHVVIVGDLYQLQLLRKCKIMVVSNDRNIRYERKKLKLIKMLTKETT